MRLLRSKEYPTQPWKNGGGLTREILVVPEDATPFDWRLSLATIETAGPFSSFADCERTLVLVEGGGVTLDFGSHGRTTLRTPGESAVFDGAWPTSCALIDGPSSDLNLIVAKTRARAESRVINLTQSRKIDTTGWEETLICCLQGEVRVQSEPGGSLVLSVLDVARCNPEDGALTCSSPDSALVFSAGVRRHLWRGNTRAA